MKLWYKNWCPGILMKLKYQLTDFYDRFISACCAVCSFHLSRYRPSNSGLPPSRPGDRVWWPQSVWIFAPSDAWRIDQFWASLAYQRPLGSESSCALQWIQSHETQFDCWNIPHCQNKIFFIIKYTCITHIFFINEKKNNSVGTNEIRNLGY